MSWAASSLTLARKVLSNNDADEEKLMVDSGAVTHVCPPSWAPGVVPTKSERPLALKVASGERLKDYGQKKEYLLNDIKKTKINRGR